jgi:hypothetical protein
LAFLKSFGRFQGKLKEMTRYKSKIKNLFLRKKGHQLWAVQVQTSLLASTPFTMDLKIHLL